MNCSCGTSLVDPAESEKLSAELGEPATAFYIFCPSCGKQITEEMLTELENSQ